MLPLTVLLKGLRLHHLPTVAAHHQVDLIVRWAVAIYVHICRGEKQNTAEAKHISGVTLNAPRGSLSFMGHLLS